MFQHFSIEIRDFKVLLLSSEKPFKRAPESTLKSQIPVLICMKKVTRIWLQKRGCKLDVFSDFSKHSSKIEVRRNVWIHFLLIFLTQNRSKNCDFRVAAPNVQHGCATTAPRRAQKNRALDAQRRCLFRARKREKETDKAREREMKRRRKRHRTRKSKRKRGR